MIAAYEALQSRNVSRLCHFTKLQKAAHILSSEAGVLASDSIRPDVKDVVDLSRYDGETDFVCCSIEYPNSWFLQKVKRDNVDPIFGDWVVLYISLDVLLVREIKFCQCNAATKHGAYINSQEENILSIFNERIDTWRPRTSEMLECCPTNGQAEVLIKSNIPREYISGVAVGDLGMARRVFALLKINEIATIPIFVAPDVLTPAWSELVRQGERANERLYCGQEDRLCQ